jgi:hypothetical protein
MQGTAVTATGDLHGLPLDKAKLRDQVMCHHIAQGTADGGYGWLWLVVLFSPRLNQSVDFGQLDRNLALELPLRVFLVARLP